MYWYLVWFSLAWLVLLYMSNAIMGKQFPRIEFKKVFVYVAGTALLGAFGEVFIGAIYTHVVGLPFWEYRVFPVHHAFTSYYSPILWGLYGFHIYLLQSINAKRKKPLNDWKFTIILALEGVILEAAINATHLLVTGTFIYYYLPSDLWHLTSFLVIPFYLAGGFALVNVMKRFTKDPIFFGTLSVVGIIVLVFLAS